MKAAWRRAISIMGIGAILFAQLAVAAYACPMLTPPLSDLQFGQAAAESTADAPVLDSSALCQRHCQDDQQNVNDSAVVAAAIAFVPAFSMPLDVVAPTPAIHSLAAPSLYDASPPPLAIRHCCFRI
jgi:hypothetical protein